MKKGNIYSTNNCGVITIIKFIDSCNIQVKFEDNTKVYARASQIHNGEVRNPNHPIVFGRGFIGQGVYSWSNSRKTYSIWYDMLRRCYDTRSYKVKPTYVGCTVARPWHNFQNFALDYEQLIGRPGWDLDKDLLKKGNRVYGPKYCILLPTQINTSIKDRTKNNGLPRGVSLCNSKTNPYYAHCKGKHLGCFPTSALAHRAYVQSKEQELRRLAQLYKKELDPRAYAALLKYTVRK